MGLLGIFKKSKRSASELPPPPPPPIKFDELSSELKSGGQVPLAPPAPAQLPRLSVEETAPPAQEIPIIQAQEHEEAPSFEEVAPDSVNEEESAPMVQPIMPPHIEMFNTPELPAPQVPKPVQRMAPKFVPKPMPVRDKTVRTEELKMREHRAAPVFVSAQDYQMIQSGIQTVRTTLAETESTVVRMGEIKTSQDKIFSDWKTQLADIEKKLAYVDSVLFSGE